MRRASSVVPQWHIVSMSPSCDSTSERNSPTLHLHKRASWNTLQKKKKKKNYSDGTNFLEFGAE